jgi:hypothetical protein
MSSTSFNSHSDLQGRHAFLSPSNYHWLNYNEQKLEARFAAHQGARRGTDLHALAHEAIRLGIKLARSNKSLATYVNDAIMFRMTCEQPLYYSDNCFGHADTISFRRMKLRIHDLKTGINATSEKQLEVYAAIFCLEYQFSPFEIEIELRIYQGDDVRVYFPTPEHIAWIMETIVDHDMRVEMMKASDRY